MKWLIPVAVALLGLMVVAVMMAWHFWPTGGKKAPVAKSSVYATMNDTVDPNGSPFQAELAEMKKQNAELMAKMKELEKSSQLNSPRPGVVAPPSQTAPQALPAEAMDATNAIYAPPAKQVPIKQKQVTQFNAPVTVNIDKMTINNNGQTVVVEQPRPRVVRLPSNWSASPLLGRPTIQIPGYPGYFWE